MLILSFFLVIACLFNFTQHLKGQPVHVFSIGASSRNRALNSGSVVISPFLSDSCHTKIMVVAMCICYVGIVEKPAIAFYPESIQQKE